MEPNTYWLTGVATIITIDASGVLVACPHCAGKHHHGRAVLGSNHVVAGCHTGHRFLREYAVDNPARR